MERNYYMVRAMASTEEDFKVFLNNSVVAIGWSDVDFTKCIDSDDVRKKVNNKYYLNKNKSPQKVSQNLNEVSRFKNIHSGDYIIIPYYSYVIIAIAENEEIYSDNDYCRDLSNQRNGYIEDVKILMKPPFDKPFSFVKMFDNQKRTAIINIIENIKNNAVNISA